MEKYKIIVCLILVSIVSQALSQSNIEKYWYYRYRLQNGFVKIGDQAGESLIAGIRNIYGDDNSAQDYNIQNHKRLDYGDQTIYLGWYIGVLATEYKLLDDAGKSTENTKTELYYAIKAIERLDELSGNAPPVNSQNNFPQHEVYCPQIIQQPITPDGLNGFFIRDDVPYGFIDPNINILNYNKINSRVNDFNYQEVNYAYSDYTAGNKHWDPYTLDSVLIGGHDWAKEMSQDELYHLMMGLALVKQF